MTVDDHERVEERLPEELPTEESPIGQASFGQASFGTASAGGLPAGESVADHELAEELAVEAGRHLLALRADADVSGGRALGARGDQSAHELLLARLGDQRPDDDVVSEHGVSGPSRPSGSRTWIVDPLDGTREFGEAGRSDWAVHVALAEGDRLVAGAVALPAQDRVLSTANPPQWTDGGERRLRIAVSRSRPPAFVAALATALDAETVPMGSAGVKITAVVRGEVDAYVHAGGQYEWDSAAPVAVARAAGMHTSRIDGSELVYNRIDPWLPDLVVCRPELANRLLAELSLLDLKQDSPDSRRARPDSKRPGPDSSRAGPEREQARPDVEQEA